MTVIEVHLRAVVNRAPFFPRDFNYNPLLAAHDKVGQVGPGEGIGSAPHAAHGREVVLMSNDRASELSREDSAPYFEHRTDDQSTILQSRTFGTLNEPGARIFWTFLDSTVVFPRGDIAVNGSLRNAANESQTVDITFPLLAGMQVLKSNGSAAWTYDSTAVTGPNTYPSDMTLSETVDIPSFPVRPCNQARLTR